MDRLVAELFDVYEISDLHALMIVNESVELQKRDEPAQHEQDKQMVRRLVEYLAVTPPYDKTTVAQFCLLVKRMLAFIHNFYHEKVDDDNANN